MQFCLRLVRQPAHEEHCCSGREHGDVSRGSLWSHSGSSEQRLHRDGMCSSMTDRARLIAGVLLALAIASCAGAAVENHTTVEVSDSAGVSIVSVRIAEDAQTCEVSGETLRIGAVDEAQGTALYLVNGAVFLSDGRIAVVNRGTSQVKVFSPAGDLLSEFGRQGQGPGEFKNLWSVHVRGVDTLVVGDYRPWRFSFFTPEGELLRRVELKPAVIERPDFAIPLEIGAGFVMEEPSFQVQDEWVDRVVPLRVYGEDGEVTGTVGDFWMDRVGYQSKEIGYVGNPIFGARASFSHLRDDLVLYGTGRYEQLEIWNIAGELQGIVRWKSREREVPPTDVDVWRRQRRESWEARFDITPQMEQVIEAQIGEHLPVAHLYPGHDQVVVSQEGGIWVEEYRRPLDEGPARWWVFGTDWRFLCSASLPSDLRVLAVGGNRVLGLARDSLDVEYLLGYDVEYPPARSP